MLEFQPAISRSILRSLTRSTCEIRTDQQVICAHRCLIMSSRRVKSWMVCETNFRKKRAKRKHRHLRRKEFWRGYELGGTPATEMTNDARTVCKHAYIAGRVTCYQGNETDIALLPRR